MFSTAFTPIQKLIFIAFVFSSTYFISSIARAAPAAVCSQYARTAVDQQRQNLNNQCGFTGFEWHGNEGAHYGWCLVASDRDQRSGTALRQRALNSCLRNQGNQNNNNNNNANNNNNNGGANDNNQFSAECDAYAKLAVRENRTAEALVCEYRGRRWNNSYQTHYRWCRTATRQQRAKETGIRKRAVLQCSAREDAERERLERERVEQERQQQQQQNQANRKEAACARYAATAIGQFQKALQLQCGFQGRRWQNNFNNHKNWCKKVRLSASRAESRARNQQLRACKIAGGGANNNNGNNAGNNNAGNNNAGNNNAGNNNAQANAPEPQLPRQPFFRSQFSLCGTYMRRSGQNNFPTRCRTITEKPPIFTVRQRPQLTVFQGRPNDGVVNRTGRFTVGFTKPPQPRANADCNWRVTGVRTACSRKCDKIEYFSFFDSGDLESLTRPNGGQADACQRTYTKVFRPRISSRLMAYDACARSAARSGKTRWGHIVKIKIPILSAAAYLFQDPHTTGRRGNWKLHKQYEFIFKTGKSRLTALVQCKQ